MKQGKRQGWGWLTILIALALLLSGCAGSPTEPPPISTSSPAESPTPSSASPTDIPTPEPTKSVLPDESPTTVAPSPSGSVAADSGFRPEVDGFSFENYGNETGASNLKADDLVRLFGERVVSSREGGEMVLTPPASKWLEEVNQAMNGGHCEGMAALCLLFYTGKSQVSDFGAETTNALQLAENEKLQREIAYWWVTQATEPTSDRVLKTITPNEVLDRLAQAFQGGKQPEESYTVGIYKADGSGGHAVTPYALQEKENGKVGILVYDNNYPNTASEIEVDRTANTWTYSGSTNPAEGADTYTGDAESKTLEIVPTSARLETQVAPFLTGAADSGQALDRWESVLGIRPVRAEELSYNEIWVDTKADFLITDAQGRRLGFNEGRFLREIPEAEAQSLKYGVNVWAVDQDPIYFMPSGLDFTMTLDGKSLTTTSSGEITMIGPGYDLEISDIHVSSGQKDALAFSSDGTRLSYQTLSDESPDIMLGMEGKEADYAFIIKGMDLQGGGTLEVARDMEKGVLSLKTTGTGGPGSYGFLMARITELEGEQIFGHDGISLAPGDTAYLYFGRWTGEGGSLTLEIDRATDGTIDETQEIPDVTDLLAEDPSE
ncbi:MAG: hypothetical protein NTU59_03705 [Coprothermobacterota bacterium]|nr:hypothetical protein [Coprothermobacterota bacterium]